jgi:hypothetical protein
MKDSLQSPNSISAANPNRKRMREKDKERAISQLKKKIKKNDLVF